MLKLLDSREEYYLFAYTKLYEVCMFYFEAKSKTNDGHHSVRMALRLSDFLEVRVKFVTRIRTIRFYKLDLPHFFKNKGQ